MAVAKGKPTSKNKTSTKKATSKASPAKKKPITNAKDNTVFRNGLLGIGLVVFCVLILLCLVSSSQAVVQVFVRTTFNGYFGILRFFALVLLALFGVRIAFGDRFPVRKSSFWLASLLLLCVATLLQVFQMDSISWELSQRRLVPNYKGFLYMAFENAKTTPRGGGSIGELLAYPLGKTLDVVGSALILFFAIGTLVVALIRMLRPDAGERMGTWIAQFRADMDEWRSEKAAQKAAREHANDADAALLVPIPKELQDQQRLQQDQNKPTAFHKLMQIASKVTKYFAPVVVSKAPPEDQMATDAGVPPLPYNAQQNVPPPNQPPHISPHQPSQNIQQRPAPYQQPVQWPIPQNQGQRPSLYIEDILSDEQYAASRGVEFTYRERDDRSHIKPLSAHKNTGEAPLPDFIAKRLSQYDKIHKPFEPFMGETEPDEVVAQQEEIFNSHDADEELSLDAFLSEDIEPETVHTENEPWEPVEAAYDPDADSPRSARRRRNKPESPLDYQPKLDATSRLDRPNWAPEKTADVPHTTGNVEELEEYRQPPFSLLLKEDKKSKPDTRVQDAAGAQKLEETLSSFGVEARVIKVVHGPAITRYELQPAPGVKVSKIVNLTDDIALNMAAIGVRIEAPIPGKAAIGIELANDTIDTVHLRDVLESEESLAHPSKLAVALGKDIAGKRIIADLSRMPHLLIAGATGSGKSVCINTLIASIIYRATPEEVRLIMIDPKKVELSLYNGIPHLLVPVVTDAKKASGALSWAVMEMEERYRLFSEVGVRDIKGYNNHRSADTPLMPQIVVIIDELSDLMLVAPGEVEESICRLAQLARACGIHLVIATQRPSVNVITGIIKVNIPSRIAFAVTSQVDSRTILDAAGAEKLLGKGDMLYAPSGGGKPMRVQGCFVSDEEVNRVVEYVKDRNTADYSQAVIDALSVENEEESTEELADIVGDTLFEQAVEMAVESGQASISMLQRRLRVGYARAGRLIDDMTKRNIIGPADGAKPREVLITREDFLIMFKKHA